MLEPFRPHYRKETLSNRGASPALPLLPRLLILFLWAPQPLPPYQQPALDLFCRYSEAHGWLLRFLCIHRLPDFHSGEGCVGEF